MPVTGHHSRTVRILCQKRRRARTAGFGWALMEDSRSIPRPVGIRSRCQCHAKTAGELCLASGVLPGQVHE